MSAATAGPRGQPPWDQADGMLIQVVPGCLCGPGVINPTQQGVHDLAPHASLDTLSSRAVPALTPAAFPACALADHPGELSRVSASQTPWAQL